MWLKIVVASAALLAIQPTGSVAEPRAKECLDLRGTATAAVSGVLTTQLFAGPPNYESIAKGDAEEQGFLLELPGRMCADDGEFISPDESFDRVHVTAGDGVVLGVLKAAVGRTVTVRGEAFGAHTGHHRAPLVLVASQVTVMEEVR